MNVQEMLEKCKSDPQLLDHLVEAVKGGKIQDFAKEHSLELNPEELQGLVKKITEEGGDLKEAISKVGGEDLKKLAENDEVKKVVEAGEGLLKNLFGGEKKD